MNPIDWIKNNLILLLGCAALVLTAMLGVDELRIAHYRTKVAEAATALAKEQTGRADDLKAHALQRADDEKAARARERELQAAADKERHDQAQALADLAARNARIAASLRDRPAARSTYGSCAAPAASAPTGCTGAGLSRPDAEVALWFAARAAQHAAERNTCYRLYGGAQKALSEPQ